MLYALCLLLASHSAADTIYLKDGKELKGIVVEDYQDRIVFSTPEGEIALAKADIRELYFDSEEDNLLKLAEQARERRDYATSFAYYSKVLKLDPDSKAARDGVVFLQGYLYRKEEVIKEYDVNRREEFERYGTVSGSPMAEEKTFKEASERMENSLGIKLAMKAVFPEVESVLEDSSAAEAGIKRGDMVIAVWGRLTGYMPLKDIVNALIEKPSLEIRMTIERTFVIDIKRGILASGSSDGLIGASLAMEFDGLTVSGVMPAGPAAEAGLEKGDIIVAIDANPTRYMPLKKAIELIRETKSKSIPITARRQITMWRKD